MNSVDIKGEIERHITAFQANGLRDSGIELFRLLGYQSDRTLDITPNSAECFIETFNAGKSLNVDKARTAEWRSVDLLFQLTAEEIKPASGQAAISFDDSAGINRAQYNSYIFFAVHLKAASYTRTDLAEITREVNKVFLMPAMILFRHGDTLTLSVIDRRLNKADTSKDVLEKVTLIKDIRITNPHRAHIEILFELSLSELTRQQQIKDFPGLHDAWRSTLDISALNKRFYGEVANWYFWALHNVEFPNGENLPPDTHHATSLIRLITRLMFVWFIKEKGMVPQELFSITEVRKLLRDTAPETSSYYKAVLQNLFFATLNTEMDDRERPRRFRGKNNGGGRDAHYGVPAVCRYEDYFSNSEHALTLFRDVPFLNGGLFECLDQITEVNGKSVRVLIDGFSEHPSNTLRVPNFLFFSDERPFDLNADYGTTGKRYKVRGIVDILNRYKFTVEENTPVEEEVALDPELLGRVFENLLASYNPETRLTARKQTGSFYTPRQIVDYMVDEALITVLESKFAGVTARDETKARLRHLFAYTEETPQFSTAETVALIRAIDELKILDPACGSGAFPMGVLHKLVHILGKLDRRNVRWKQRQLDKLEETPDPIVRDRQIAELENAFQGNELDYGRKLYLIRECIYGVDIQPIAVQIARLRFFISLVIDQRINPAAKNRGILPLPNLETKFVAANSLLPAGKGGQMVLPSQEILAREAELRHVRDRYLTARTLKTKAGARAEDKRIRSEIAEILKEEAFPVETITRLMSWDPYNPHVAADFFDPAWMFGIQNGFDVTIGNPPYVAAHHQDQDERRRILTSGLYETLYEKWDLFMPFIERGMKLLSPGGVSTLIVSDGFCHAKYAIRLQDWLLANSRVVRLDFFGKIKVFDAAVHNVTYLAHRLTDSENCPERRVHHQYFGTVTYLPTKPQDELDHRAFFPEDTYHACISKPTLPLGEICYVSFGCRPNSDEKTARGEFVAADLVSNEPDKQHPKRYIEAKDILRWTFSQHRWLEWGTARSPKRLARPTFEELYEAHEKIVAADVSGAQNRSAYDCSQVFHSHTLVSAVPWHYLAGVRNNSLKKTARYRGETPRRPDLPARETLEATSRRFSTKFVLAAMNSAAAGDYLRSNRRSNIHLYPDDWKTLPIPDATSEQQAPVIARVDQILAVRAATPNADVSEIEAQIDELMINLYGVR